MSSNAEAFVTMVLPWEQDGAAYCNLQWQGDNAGSSYMAGHAFKQPSQLIHDLGWLQKKPNDFYVCISSQAVAVPAVNKRNVSYYKAVRRGQNAVRVRNFFIDIDVGEKTYPTSEAALQALEKFVTDTGLPMPSAVVMSGSGGFHVHWATEELLKPAEWMPYARAFTHMMQQYGLLADTQCTTDIVRGLRVPDTFNYKSNPPNPVTLLSLGVRISFTELKIILDPYKTAISPPKSNSLQWEQQPAPATVTLTGKDLEEANELSAGIAHSSPVSLDEVSKNCAFINEALTTGGKDFKEPLWFLTTQIATYTTGERADAHRMASGHPDYLQETTDAKYDAVHEARSGWPKCITIQSYGYTGCKSCPHKDAGNSPLNYGSPPPLPELLQTLPEDVELTKEQLGALPALPQPFFYDDQGFVRWQAPEESGFQGSPRIMHYRVVRGWLTPDPYVLHYRTFIRDRSHEITIPAEFMHNRENLLKTLGAQGIMVDLTMAPLVARFFMSWVSQLQARKDAVAEKTSVGWTKDDGFAFAGTVYLPGKTRPATPLTGGLLTAFTPRGELDSWRAAAKIITDQGRPELDTILATSFAGPLVYFAADSGVVISAFSAETGIGKTTAMKTAAAVWGHPKHAMLGLQDTYNAATAQTGIMQNLTMYWDEVKTLENRKNVLNMIFQLGQGRDKKRLHRNATMRDSSEWKTLFCVANNEPLFEAISEASTSSAAGVVRLFEFRVTRGTQGQLELSYVNRVIADLEHNYGRAGEIYAEFLGRHHVKVKNEFDETYSLLTKALRADADERFWITPITALLLGAKYANELDLATINRRALYAFLAHTLQGMRGLRKDETVQDMTNSNAVRNVLSNYYAANFTRHGLLTDKVNQGAGRPQKIKIENLTDALKFGGPYYIQRGKQDDILRIQQPHLKEWCTDKGYAPGTFINALKDKFNAKQRFACIGSGTDRSMPGSNLIEIDLTHADLKGLFE